MRDIAHSGARRQARRLAKLAGLTMLCGLVLLALAPAYALLCVNYSGRLVLAQAIPASAAVRGFDFGPVYLRQGEAGRYRIAATFPQADADFWHTSFSVLDQQKRPVYQQEELHFIGDQRFRAGARDVYAKGFTLDKATGYYYFQFKANNGVYEANQQDLPVVEFSIRQGVIHGAWLWLPVAGALLLGALLIYRGVVLIGHLGHEPQGAYEGRGGRGLRGTEQPAT